MNDATIIKDWCAACGMPEPSAGECQALAVAIRLAPQAPAAPCGDERTAFEAWIKKDGGDLSTFGSGQNRHYNNSAVNNAWTGWSSRAAMAAPAAPAAVPDEREASIRYDVLHEFATKHRVDYNELCTTARAALAATPAAAPVVPKWIDDPHDIEQGQMLNPEWVKAQKAAAAPVVLPEPDVQLCAVEDRLEPVVRKVVGASPGKPLDLFTADTVHALLAGLHSTAAAPMGLPSGWVPCILTHDGQHPDAGVGQAVPAAPAVDASDTARLEWLVKEDNCVVNEGVNGCWVCWIDERNPDWTEYQKGSFPTFRAAIDAARAAQAKEGGA